MSNSAWKLDRDGQGIAWLTLDKPDTSANTLSQQVMRELDALLQSLARSPPRGVVIRSGKASGFIAGADINEFTTLANAADGYQLTRFGQITFGRLERLPCPTVAAIHGFALGGGLELALACRYRAAVADERLQLGLPEVQLGIHPGFGGTVRAVRLLGVRPAMQLMLTGRPVRADKAARIGLVDRLVPAAELENAARELVLQAPPPHRPPLMERVLSLAPARPFVKPALIKQVAAKVSQAHYPAPYAMIDLWARNGGHGETAFEAEARSIAAMFLTPTAHNLIRVFLLQDRLKAQSAKPAADVKAVHVIGAGVMGGDIAAWCALRGFEVTLQDRGLEFIEPAIRRAAELFEKRLREPEKIAAARARLRADVAAEGVAAADVVVEAIFESLEAKRALYATLEPRMKPAAILATNTSSLKLEPLAEQLARPERLVGLHFFNPVSQMPLVEVVCGENTATEVEALAVAFTRRLDKLPIVCRSAPGFVVNRVLMPYLHEAMRLAQEDVPLAAIDAAATDFGMPVGPIELADVVGLDVAKDVGEIIAAELGRAVPAHPRLAELVAARRLGRKTGAGFYTWHEGHPVKPAATRPAPQDATDRMLLSLVNEAVACLREGIVGDADLLDAAVIFGTGFAPFRGGPIAYARARGIPECVRRLTDLASRHGDRFRPDEGWSLLEQGLQTVNGVPETH
ncbi:MAG TPA: 3-hydroxyacyl-CoA dehydrogenase NAD-binding domain-containing protein [Steroidobacteraceae bacterium]|nr:3-hydroxyacyl-CoA dehydrogenase NAD-binding domain-containing protein [Steroidobacteraceae bacterium]